MRSSDGFLRTSEATAQGRKGILGGAARDSAYGRLKKQKEEEREKEKKREKRKKELKKKENDFCSLT